jgi:hypothetical protein
MHIPSAQGGFTAVLAIGSNAAPSQLDRKYGGGVADWPRMDVAAPCVRVGLAEHDVVYAPLLSSYGSIPATLQAPLPPPRSATARIARLASCRLGRGLTPPIPPPPSRISPGGSGARGRCAGCGSRS